MLACICKKHHTKKDGFGINFLRKSKQIVLCLAMGNSLSCLHLFRSQFFRVSYYSRELI